MNERNELIAHADQRAERLIALGADRGLAREIAASELGLIGGDRIELDGREGRRGDLSLQAAGGPGSSPLSSFATDEGRNPGVRATLPNILETLSPDREQRAASHGKTSHGSAS